AAGRPGAEQRAAGAVDVDVLVGVHDPLGRAGGVGGYAHRGQVVQAEAVGRLRSPGGLVLVGRVGPAAGRRRIVDHVELGVLVAGRDRARGLAAREGGRLGVGERERKGQRSGLAAAVENRDVYRRGGDAGTEGERAVGGGGVVGAGDRGAVGGGVVDGQRQRARRRVRDRANRLILGSEIHDLVSRR